MQPMPPAWTIFRQICLLALLGLAVIFLSGPLLAVLSVVVSIGAVVLAFALVGFVVWTLFRTLVLGQQIAWQGAYGMGQHLGHFLRQTTLGLWKVVAFPVRAVGWVVGTALTLVGWTVRTAFWGVWFLLEVALVGAVGAVVGAGVGFLTAAEHHVGPSVVSNALVGALLAAVVAIVMTVLERRPRPVPQTERLKPAV